MSDLVTFINTYQIILAAIIGFVSILIAYFVESRRRTEKIAADTVVERLLPFYSSLLTILNRLDLLGLTEFLLEEPELNAATKDLYLNIGKSFFAITDSHQRQLILNCLQLLELFEDCLRKNVKQDEVNRIRGNLIRMLNSVKQLVEEDLMHFRKLGKIPQFENQVFVDYERYHEIKNSSFSKYLDQSKG